MGKHATMPCGWGCGEQLTARTIRSHFTNCPRRDKPTYPDTAAAEARGLNEVNGLLNKWAEESIRRVIQSRGVGMTAVQLIAAAGETEYAPNSADTTLTEKVHPLAELEEEYRSGNCRETVLVPLEDEL